MRGALIITILVVLFSTLIISQPEVLVDQNTPEGWPCQEFKVIQKTFTARSSDINVGLVCPHNSRIVLFDELEDSTNPLQAYKNQGQLPQLSNFEIGNKYLYQCYSCENTCALSAMEKEIVNLNQFFQGVRFRMTDQKAGFNSAGIWQTQKGDAGDYLVNVETYDNNNWNEVQFCVSIKESNEPARLALEKTKYVVKEGELVTIMAECNDPEGQQISLDFSGWMNAARKRTTFDDAGSHQVNVSCLDSTGLGEEKIIDIFVLDVNRAPVIEDVWGE
ncbi:hypothetical protein COY27_02170 [Candidatus Woesearchaeota archaeon CG_4_10_14_0_2_um_filter_33_13]|nr:MAG: hypothetical protein COY27_02170 [Candidatus Woesearchaeota archaeon CG_4_10_14_0_2_um_filter_33_13]